MSQEEAGICLVCGVATGESWKIVCESCPNHLGGLLACAKCRWKRTLTMDELGTFLQTSGSKAPQRPGVIILLDECLQCTGQVTTGKIIGSSREALH